MQQIALKQVGKMITIRLPYVNTPVTFFIREGQDYTKLITLVKSYNRWNRIRDFEAVNQLLDEYTKPLPNPEVVANRIERKKLKLEIGKLSEKVKSMFDIYQGIPGLVVYPDKVTLEGFSFGLPKEYLDTVKSWYEAGEELTPLYNFMYLLAGNPVEHVRNELFNWIKTHKFILTPSGYIACFRNVVLLEEGINVTLRTFVQDWYVKVKLQRRSPSIYSVYEENGTYRCSRSRKKDSETLVGNLNELFSTSSETVYTDAHSRTFRIKIGEPVTMNRDDCDQTRTSCSTGLHCCSLTFVKYWYQTYNCGNRTLMCLVSPANIVSVPSGKEGKIRSCEYFPVAEVDRNSINDFWNDEYRIYDEDYAQLDFERIQQQLKEQEDGVEFVYGDDSGIVERIRIAKEKLASFRVRNIAGETLTHLSGEEQERILNSRIKLVA